MRRLADYRDAHAGETILVCGCGVSLNHLPADVALTTIGVNDVGRRFDPTYLVVLNPRGQFQGDRFRHVEASRAMALFSQLDLGLPRGRGGRETVRFRLGRRGGTDLSPLDTLPFTRNSPYVALCLALYMGAARVGVLGVDFTDHHFFADTGRHPLARGLSRIDDEYRALAAAHGDREIVNLSAESRLTALPKADLDRFLAAATPAARRRPAAPRLVPPPAHERNTHMRIAIERHRPGIVGDFLDGLAETAAKLGHTVSRDPAATRARRDVVSIVWNGRRHRANGPTLYCEHGWLPRWEYQVSRGGINADHHAAPFRWDGRPLDDERLAALDAHLAEIRRGGPEAFSYMQTKAPALADLPREFLLVPLQMEWDTNIRRHVPAKFRRMQALVDHVSAFDPPYPIVFKQHPADVRRGNRQLRLRLPRQGDVIRRHAAGNVHQLLKSGRCRGVIALNSNVVHDGLIWEVPAIVLGENIWPRQGETPFLTDAPDDWSALEAQLTDPERLACRRAYAHFVIENQWKLDDARRPERVAELLATVAPPVAAQAPRALPSRRRPPRRSVPVAARAGGPVVNVAALDKGWFFEDLKRHFGAAHRPGVRVVVSDRPRRDADSWIVIRTHEAAASPDPARTVVQIHDMFDAGLYRPGGKRAAVRQCGAVSFTHPDQRAILEASGVPLAGKAVLDRPIGALEAFGLRPSVPDRFTVGWVGRPVRHSGKDLKRVDCVVQAIRRLGADVRVVLVGERLEAQHRELTAAGVACTYHRRARTPIERYPEHYKGLDCLAVFSTSEAGPMCLFEALATGVPVVSSPVGWAPQLLSDGENGFLVDSVPEMVAAFERIRAERRRWFARRGRIRESLGGHTLESWVDANLDLALGLAQARAA